MEVICIFTGVHSPFIREPSKGGVKGGQAKQPRYMGASKSRGDLDLDFVN
jgi:hypothetical protein